LQSAQNHVVLTGVLSRLAFVLLHAPSGCRRRYPSGAAEQ